MVLAMVGRENMWPWSDPADVGKMNHIISRAADCHAGAVGRLSSGVREICSDKKGDVFNARH